MQLFISLSFLLSFFLCFFPYLPFYFLANSLNIKLRLRSFRFLLWNETKKKEKGILALSLSLSQFKTVLENTMSKEQFPSAMVSLIPATFITSLEYKCLWEYVTETHLMFIYCFRKRALFEAFWIVSLIILSSFKRSIPDPDNRKVVSYPKGSIKGNKKAYSEKWWWEDGSLAALGTQRLASTLMNKRVRFFMFLQ